jgi:hypothetical protein
MYPSKRIKHIPTTTATMIESLLLREWIIEIRELMPGI